MSSELVIEVGKSEIRIALLQNKELVELKTEKSNIQFAVGDIYLGKVKKIMPSLNAGFVDVGYQKDAFLHYLDLGHQFSTLQKYLSLLNSKSKSTVPPLQKFKAEPDINKEGKITELLKPGHEILIQIAKEPISSKGPRLTSELSIAGRNLVLMPFSDKVSISQKISTQEEKKRLKKLVQSIRPKNFGIIVRTAAEGKRVAELDKELRYLIKKWEESIKIIRNSKPPKLVVGEISRISAILRDMLDASFSSIFVDDEEVMREVRDYVHIIAPDKTNIVKHYAGKVPIMENFNVEKQAKSLFGKTVSFHNGAYLIIEHTEALHVIDVNSGNRTKTGLDQETNALEVNLAATKEIARQLRLRDMGGIIVVDFIDMHGNDNRQKVFDKMKEEMAIDRTKHNILPLSKFGLMQITRQRVRPEMKMTTNENCPVCLGEGVVPPPVLIIDRIKSAIEYISREMKNKYIVLRAHPFIAAYLKQGFPSIKTKWMIHFGCRIVIQPIHSYNFLEYHIFDKSNTEIKV